LRRPGQRLNRCDAHQILHGTGELPIERDQGIGLQLGQGDVLGIQRVRPSELVGDIPRYALQHPVSEQPDPQPAHVVELPLGILLGHLTAADRLVEKRQQLRAQQRRSQDPMLVTDRGLVLSQVNGDVRTDHVPGHGR
jgi:hypothetical protein